MNQFTKSLALVLVMVMCVGLFTACGGNNTEGTNPSGTTPSGTTAPVEKNVVGIVQEINSSFVVLDLCPQDVQGLSYKELDAATLAGTGESDYVYLNSTAQFTRYEDGKLKSMNKSELAVGDLVVVGKTTKGIQEFIVLRSVEVPTEPTESTNPTESTGAAG